jgi:hypothetical protein
LKVRARPAARPGGRGGALDADVGRRRHLLVPAPPPDFIGTFAAGSNPVFEASAAAIARVNNVLDAVMVPPVGIFARANCCPSHFTDSFVRYPTLDSCVKMLFGGVQVSANRRETLAFDDLGYTARKGRLFYTTDCSYVQCSVQDITTSEAHILPA